MVDRDIPQPPQDEAASRYEQFREMPLEDLRGHLAQLEEQFEGVVRHYTGPIGRFRRRLKGEDQEVVEGMMGDLLPMSHNTEAQKELSHYVGTSADDPFEGTVYRGVTDLMRSVMMFLGKYPEDTGVQIVWHHEPGGMFD